MQLLKALAARSVTGWRLTDLAAHCGLEPATAHRVLACLARQRLVQQRAADRHYAPGPLLFELGLAFPALERFRAACAPALSRISRRYRGATLLYLRSESHFVCIARGGESEVRGLTIELGTRRPLAVSAPGVAILITLAAEERRPLYEANLREIARAGPRRRDAIERVLRRSLRAGAGVNLGDIVPGLWSFGVPIFNRTGVPFASIGLTGRATDYSRRRIPEVISTLRSEARGIERDCAGLIRSIAG